MMTQILEEILGGHQISDFSRKWIENNATDDDAIRATYNALKRIGLKDEKIASQAQLLGRDPETIERNYQNHIGLLRSNYEDRNSGKEILLQQAQLLGVSPDTLESNVQWFADRKFAYGNGMLLGTKTQTKRKKLAWILREVFDYRTHPQDQRREVINNMYKFVADNPHLMIKSTKALEGMKEKLVEKAEQYK